MRKAKVLFVGLLFAMVILLAITHLPAVTYAIVGKDVQSISEVEADSYTLLAPYNVLNMAHTCNLAPDVTTMYPQEAATNVPLIPEFQAEYMNGNWVADYTILDIAPNADFSERSAFMGLTYAGIQTFQFPYNLESDTVYYWRFYSVCGYVQSPYTQVYTFTTGTPAVVLDAPVLTSPVNGVEISSRNVVLQWEAVSGADGYLLNLRPADESWHSFDWRTGTQSGEIYLTAGGTYEWWVTAYDDFALGTESEIWQFTVPTDAGTTSLSSFEANGNQMIYRMTDDGIVVEDIRID